MRLAARRGFRVSEDWQKARVMGPAPDPLPVNLPAPEDDGAARHLPGVVLPPLSLDSTAGHTVTLDEVSKRRWVLYVYPLTGEPGVDVPRWWDEIPGARGCSQEACSFRDNLAALVSNGADAVLGLSTDRAEYQQDLVRRLHLPYAMVSDPDATLGKAINLPSFEFDGAILYKRLTMVVMGARIEHVFYPVFPPDRHADEVVEWLASHPARFG
jgi:peroxiredoxin